MTTLSAADRLVDDYLKSLDSALRDLPAARRRDILDEIRAHIAALRATSPSTTEADIRNILDRMGDPEEIAREAGVGLARSAHRNAVWDGATFVFLLFGGVFLTPLGWLIGVVLLWTSTVWTWRDKIIGTLFLPGGLLAALTVGLGVNVYRYTSTFCRTINGRQICTTSSKDPTGDLVYSVILGALVLLPLLTTAYLSYHLSHKAARLTSA